MKKLFAAITLILCAHSTTIYAGQQSECEAKVKMAQAAKIIRGLSVRRDGVHVVVDADVWKESTYNTKLGLAANVECAIVNPGERLTGIVLHDHRTNKVVGRYRYPRLTVE